MFILYSGTYMHLSHLFAQNVPYKCKRDEFYNKNMGETVDYLGV